MNITIGVKKNNKMIAGVRSHKIRRVLNFARKINFQDRDIEISLHVYYGKTRDCFGEMTKFENDGIYKFESWDDKEDALEKKFWLAFNAFIEKGVFDE